MGAWYNVRAETNLIFSTSPQYLWRKLLDRAEPAPVAKVADLPFPPFTGSMLGNCPNSCAATISHPSTTERTGYAL